MAFREYDNPAELKKVQELSLKILKELDRVCRQLDISYLAWAGTALGAVRHQGFIPWDDDIDIAMVRSDYEDFLKRAPSIIGDEFEIVNMRNEENFVSMVTYVTLKDTIFIPDFFEGCKYQKPICLEIDVLDNMPDNKWNFRMQKMKTWVWGRLIFLSASPTPYLPFDGIRKKIVNAVCSIAVGGLKLFHLTPQKLQARLDKAATKYNDRQTDYVADYADKNPEKWSARHDELFPTVDMQFDGISIKVPRDYDTILTRNYGDYMKLPPIEERKNHRPSQLDFGPYA